MVVITPVAYTNPNKPAFKGKDEGRKCISHKSYDDYDEYRYEVPATSGKKATVAIASLFLTGGGQFINGDILKGIAFICGTIGATLIAAMTKSKGLISLVAAGGAIWSAVDAAKNAKSTAIEMVSKDSKSAEKA